MTTTKSVSRNADRLLEMEAECQRLEASEGTQEQRDRLSAKADELRWEIANTPADSPVGMAVKIRVLLESARTGTAEWDEAVCESLLTDLRG